MNNYLDLVKPRYVIKTNKGYIEYIENDPDSDKIEFGVCKSIINAKDYCKSHALRLIKSLKEQGDRAEILLIEGI